MTTPEKSAMIRARTMKTTTVMSMTATMTTTLTITTFTFGKASLKMLNKTIRPRYEHDQECDCQTSEGPWRIAI